MLKKSHLFGAILLSFYLSACSTTRVDLTGGATGDSVPTATTSKALSSFNRDAYAFNKSIDNGVLKPVAQGYKKVVPDIVDEGITNVFSNLGETKNILNNLLQLKVKDAVSDTGRFVINSTVGVGGFFDVASKVNLEKHNEDFGQTLAKWGVGSGEYLMLPIFGPSSVRDAFGLVIDSVVDPSSSLEGASTYKVVEIIDKRADLLSIEEAFKGISDDEYGALRDAWLQRRTYLISDGKLDQKAVDEKKSLIDELEGLD